MANRENFAPINTLAFALKTTYAVCLIFLVYVLVSDISELILIQSVIDGAQITEAEASKYDTRRVFVGIVQFLLWMFAFVLFLIWYYRTYKNLNLLYGYEKEYSNKMAVANFFIPIISLWRPYKSTKEIWSISNPGDSPKGQPIFDSSFMLINIWWGLFLVQNYLGQFLLKSAFKDQTLQDIYMTSMVTLGSDVLDIPLFVLELFLVIKITGWQNSRIRESRFSLT